MNEKVAHALQRGKELVMAGYEKGNTTMDKVGFLKSKKNKLIAWGVAGVVAFVAICCLFTGGETAESAFRKMGESILNKDVNGFLALMYDKDGEVSLSKAGEWRELATQRFKEMLESEDGKNMGNYMATAKIISIKTHANKATIKFRPNDAKEWKELKDEGCLGLKIDAVKVKGSWKIAIETFEPIMKN